MANEATSTHSPPPPQALNTAPHSKATPTLRTSSSVTLKPSPNNSRNTSPARKPAVQPQSPLISASSRPASQAVTPASLQRGFPGLSDMQRSNTLSNASSRSQTSTAPSSPLPSVPPSPRIKSPPPPSSRRSSVSSAKLSDSESTDIPRSTHSTAPSKPSKDVPDRSPSPTQTQQPAPAKPPRGPTGRGPKLETVQEGDHSASPREQSELARRAEEEKQQPSKDDTDATPKRSATAPQTLGTPSDQKQAMPPPPSRKRSTSSLAGAKSRTSANEGSSKVMTVETETVSTIPQAALISASDRATSGRGDGYGTVRGRASHETIRPKKDKKKVVRKPQSTTAGSSKADIFEAKVASEIEGEDSESDETFVYETKPPEPRSRQRHHSRTPSITSMSTLNDRKPGQYSTDRPVKPKRSMKFVSGGWTGSIDDENSERDGGTVRTPHLRGNLRRDLHGRRLGRNEGAYDSSVDSESPFSQAAKLRITPMAGSARHSLKSDSPGSRTPTQIRTPIKKGHSDLEYDSGFDERTPLMGSVRRHKRHARHPRHSQLEELESSGQRPGSWVRRLFCYISAFLLIAILILLGAAVLYLAGRPLFGVDVVEIRNILASEQEIMLDLVVKATNPNIVQINIKEMDVNVFAKSRHVGDKSLYRVLDGIDEGTDPIEDPEGDHQTMLLGRIFHFDSALSFDPSPLRRQPQRSAGELRLMRPGNRTETGGSARWERVLQHQFVLIVRGVLRYELPLSTNVRSVPVGASVLVKPEEGVDDKGNLHVVQLDHLPPIGEDGEEMVDLLPGAAMPTVSP